MKEDRAWAHTVCDQRKGTDMKLRDPELLGLPKRGLFEPFSRTKNTNPGARITKELYSISTTQDDTDYLTSYLANDKTFNLHLARKVTTRWTSLDQAHSRLQKAQVKTGPFQKRCKKKIDLHSLLCHFERRHRSREKRDVLPIMIHTKKDSAQLIAKAKSFPLFQSTLNVVSISIRTSTSSPWPLIQGNWSSERSGSSSPSGLINSSKPQTLRNPNSGLLERIHEMSIR